MRKLKHEVDVLELVAKRRGEEFWGTKEDKLAWEAMKEWEIESEKFRLFCEDRLSGTDFTLIFGERSQWPPEGVDWFSVLKKRDELFCEFEELTGCD